MGRGQGDNPQDDFTPDFGLCGSDCAENCGKRFGKVCMPNTLLCVTHGREPFAYVESTLVNMQDAGAEEFFLNGDPQRSSYGARGNQGKRPCSEQLQM